MTAYRIGDKPGAPLILELDVDLAPFTSAAVTVGGVAFATTIVGTGLRAAWPITSVFTVAGLVPVSIVLTSATLRLSLEGEALVVEDPTGWQTLDSARNEWTDAPYNDVQLFELLDIAAGQVLVYAPALVVGARIPTAYATAQLMQARNIWNASKVNPSGDMGDGSFVITPKPLDWMIKQILRPKRAVPVMF